MTDSYRSSVFINCPFDDTYQDTLKAIVFGLLWVGAKPVVAAEELDSGKPRIEKIVRMIRRSSYAIHDLSRLRATEPGELARMNMPFELGLDVGCRRFGGGRLKQKRCLILLEEPYLHQKALSDLSGSDVKLHRGEPEAALRETVLWLGQVARLKLDQGPNSIWNRFLQFNAEDHALKAKNGHSAADLAARNIGHFKADVLRWMKSAAGN